MDNTFEEGDFIEDQSLQARECTQSSIRKAPVADNNIAEPSTNSSRPSPNSPRGVNAELKEYIAAIARLNDTIDSDDKFEFCRTYYDPDKNNKLTPNQKKYGYQPTGNENALGLGVPEGFVLYDFDEPSDKFREYYQKTWGHTGTKPEGCGHLLFRCKDSHESMTSATLTIFGSSVEMCRKGFRPAFTPGSRKVKGGGITHHWNGIETVLDEPEELRRERMKVNSIPSTPSKEAGTTATTAQEIALALNGVKYPSGWLAHCPAHDDENPSFTISEESGKILFGCRAGCSQQQVMNALKIRGLWGVELTPDDKKAYALEIWEESQPAENTLVETYLKSLGWDLLIPSSLRFHPGLKHKHGDGAHFPCMVGLITHSKDESAMAIHRTFLAHDGKGVSPVNSPRMRLGACTGGVVRLGKPGETLLLGKEIEKCLSAMREKGLPAWSYSSSRLKEIIFPPNVKMVRLLNDYGNDRWIRHNFQKQAAKLGIRVSFEHRRY